MVDWWAFAKNGFGRANILWKCGAVSGGGRIARSGGLDLEDDGNVALMPGTISR